MIQTISLVHEGQEFKNCTVYMSGNSFYDCRFFRCTLVLREGGLPNLVGCSFECCNWHVDLLISDHRVFDSFVKTMVPLIRGSLPRAFAETKREASSSQAESGGDVE